VQDDNLTAQFGQFQRFGVEPFAIGTHRELRSFGIEDGGGCQLSVRDARRREEADG